MKTLRIALTGGGTAGHIYPLIAVAEELEKISIDKKLIMEIRYFGAVNSYKPELEDAGIKASKIISGKIRRYFSFLNIIDVPKIFIGFLQALFKFYFFMPDVLFSKGGTGAFPVVLVAWFYRIPVIIHESDAQPGLNNLFSARFAKRIAVSFQKGLDYFDPRKSAYVGLPIRNSLIANKPEMDAAKDKLGFDPQKPLVVFLGGSQGSQKINELVLLSLKNLLSKTQVLHQTGASNFPETEAEVKSSFPETLAETGGKSIYRIFPYLDITGMRLALSAADLVVARSGSNIFEIAAFSKPAILIPIAESANDHQRLNAYEFSKAGAAIVIEEANLLPGIFMTQITETLANKDLLRKMGAASANFFKPDAAKVMAEEIVRLAK
ncbi:MAG TPA: UDP-N-acetylglucosamine--N-acetylmuramyl-(pentapeptide) pyrophosphoryl-undecaprenol N-acetylglucosamine transferase [Candidatus Paceibacterota bacterium]|nr:UDP-N-acetylglucosamine--N-acetylmuramyl-(pentapeptide) pyrophosphoryl-undecaprenol N-acetylglucosamine transferase [Candidatus Paceibacterota bacterium]